MTNTEVLRERVKASGLKLQYIADRMGISRHSLTMKIEGKYEFKPSEIKTLSGLLRIETPEEIALIFLG